MPLNKLRVFSDLLRISNWSKNALILFPCFFGKKITDLSLLAEVLIAAFIFCLLSSSVYIINDLVDAPNDRNHPVKKNRPLAAKKISPLLAVIILAILLTAVTILSFLYLSDYGKILLGFYLLFNLLYSFFLKNILIIDIFSIAVFFEIRLFFGSIVSGITLSHWLVLTVFFLASLIAMGKRRDDVLLKEENKINARVTAKYYSVIFLDAM